MTGVVPESDYWPGKIVFVAQCTEAGRAQHEVSAIGCRFDPEPPGGQHASEVPTGKEQNVPGDFPHSAYDAVRARADLLGCLASRATVREQVPPRALRPNVDTTAAFILAIIPLDEVRIYIGDGAKPSQFASLARPLEWYSR